MARKKLRRVNTVWWIGPVKWHWVCASTVHDKLALSDSRYFPYNQYILTKTLLRRALVYNHRDKMDTGTNWSHKDLFLHNKCRPELESATFSQYQNGVIPLKNNLTPGRSSLSDWEQPHRWVWSEVFCYPFNHTKLWHHCVLTTHWSTSLQHWRSFKAAIINIFVITMDQM